MGGKVTPAQAHNAKAKPVGRISKTTSMHALLHQVQQLVGVRHKRGNPKRQPNSDAPEPPAAYISDESGVRGTDRRNDAHGRIWANM